MESPVHSSKKGLSGGPGGDAIVDESGKPKMMKPRRIRARNHNKVRVKLPPIESYQKELEFPADGPGRVVVRLERLMGSDRVRITDSKYMATLLERLEEQERMAWTKRRLGRIKAERNRYRQLAIDGLMEPGPDMQDLYFHPVFRVNRILNRLSKMDTNITLTPSNRLPPITPVDPFRNDNSGREFINYPGHISLRQEELSDLGSRAELYAELMGDIPGSPSQNQSFKDEYEGEGQGEIYLKVPTSKSRQGSPSKSRQPSPSKTMQAPPSKTMQAPPSKTMQAPPSKTMQASPSKTMQATPSKTMEASPSKTMQVSPSKTTQASPSKTIQASPSKTMQAPPSKTMQATPSKTMQATPSKTMQAPPSKTMQASQSKTMQMSSSKSQKMSTSKSQKLSTSKSHKMSTSKSQKMSTSKSQKMSASKTQQELQNEGHPYRTKSTRQSEVETASLSDMQQKYGLPPTQDLISEWEPFRSHLVDMVFQDEGNKIRELYDLAEGVLGVYKREQQTADDFVIKLNKML